MGAKYTVRAWGEHDGEGKGYSDRAIHQGQKLVVAAWVVWKARRRGFGCVSLEVRG